MHKAVLVTVLCMILTACGSGGEPAPAPPVDPVIAVTQPAGTPVVRVTVNEDYRVGDTSGEYLVNVTFATTQREFNVEYCDTPIHLGDVVKLAAYGPGTTLIFVNDVMVGNLIDWDATQHYIDNPTYEDWSIQWA